MTEELLTKEEASILCFFLAKRKNEHEDKVQALKPLDCDTYEEFDKSIASMVTDWPVKHGRINDFTYQLAELIKGTKNYPAGELEKQTFQTCKAYKEDEFKTYIDKYLRLKTRQSMKLQTPTLLNKDEVWDLLFLLSERKEQILDSFKSFSNRKDHKIYEKDIYQIIMPIKGFQEYYAPGLRRNKKQITHRNSLQANTVIDRNKSKSFDDFQPLIDKVKRLTNSYNNEQEKLKQEELTKPYNRIIYGAPGTGKSHLLNKECEQYFAQTNYTRVTFYDGYTYGQFVGSYKPVPKGDHVTYQYVAGIFMKILVKAIQKPEENFCLIIEEINRARTDKVFGDIFQLLDRNDSGLSQYAIELSAEQQIYLDSVLNEEQLNFIENNQLRIPNNLYLWATMNSADQGVYPLDSAFKRRWHFEHLSLNANQENFGDKGLKYMIQFDKHSIEWNDFRTIINAKLSQEKIFEDRLMAPFFINPSDFDANHVLINDVFTDKILMYLFDDILKYKDTKILFNPECNTFSQLKEYYIQGKQIFTLNFEEKSSSVDS